MKRFIKVEEKQPKYKRRTKKVKNDLKYRPLKVEIKKHKPRRKRKDDRPRKGTRIALYENDYLKKGRYGGRGKGNKKAKGNIANLNRNGNVKNLNRKGNPQNLNRKGRKKGSKDKNKRQYTKKREYKNKPKGNIKNLNRKGRKKGARDKKPRKKYERKQTTKRKINKKDLQKNKKQTKNKNVKKNSKNVVKTRKGTRARKGNRIGRKTGLFAQNQKDFRKITKDWKPKPVASPIKPLSPISTFEDMVKNWDHIQDILKEYNAIDHWISFTSRNPLYREWVGRVMERLGIDMDWELFIDYLVKIDNSTQAERDKLIESFKDKRRKDYRNLKENVIKLQDSRLNRERPKDIYTSPYFAGYNPDKKIVVYDLDKKKGKK